MSRLARFIRAQNLKDGDRLPPQQELRAIIGASNDTLNVAMRALTDCGVLVRAPSRGTLVRDLKALPPPDWTIGVATLPADEHRYSAEMSHRFAVALSRAGCHCRTYIRKLRPNWPNRIGDFEHLEQDVAAERLDGLAFLTWFDEGDWARLADQGLAAVHAGFWEGPRNGIAVDTGDMVTRALTALAGRGARHPAMIASGIPAGNRELRACAAYRDTAAALGLRQAVPPQVIRATYPEGVRIGREWLALPAARRPDAIVCTDDYVTAGLAQTLLDAAGYQPLIAALTCRQLPLAYPLPVIRFVFDMNSLIDAGVRLLLDGVLRPDATDRVEWVTASEQPELQPVSPSAMQPMHAQPADGKVCRRGD